MRHCHAPSPSAVAAAAPPQAHSIPRGQGAGYSPRPNFMDAKVSRQDICGGEREGRQEGRKEGGRRGTELISMMS
jgi:hypothetical protein